MIIGVLKEIKSEENRVALTPAGVELLRQSDHSVLVEQNAGLGSGFNDEAFIKAGAEIVGSAPEIYSRSEMVMHVKEPQPSEYELIKEGQIIFTYGEAKELGIKSPDTFNRVIHELVEVKGFIDVAERGNWYEKKPTKFAISQRWKRYGTPDYECVEIPRILPRGKGFQKNKTRYDGS